MENVPQNISQNIPQNIQYCQLCVRRVAVCGCENPDCRSRIPFQGCDSCSECIHKPLCDINQNEINHIKYGINNKVLENKLIDKNKNTNQEVDNIEYSDNKNYLEPAVCVVCGEIADIKCVQCRDLYCSRTWMGNTGCFVSTHSKGNRMKHITEVLNHAVI